MQVETQRDDSGTGGADALEFTIQESFAKITELIRDSHVCMLTHARVPFGRGRPDGAR